MDSVIVLLFEPLKIAVDSLNLWSTIFPLQHHHINFTWELNEWMPFYGAILYWTGYSCQNKCQNALFSARKLKFFPYWGGKRGHPLPKPNFFRRRSCPIFANPQLFFFTILTLPTAKSLSEGHHTSLLQVYYSLVWKWETDKQTEKQVWTKLLFT